WASMPGLIRIRKTTRPFSVPVAFIGLPLCVAVLHRSIAPVYCWTRRAEPRSTMSRKGPTLEVPAHVAGYLRTQQTVTMATAPPPGVPRAPTLTYASDGLVLYVWMRPDTVTARHIAMNPRVAFAIDEYSEDWRQTKGIQGTGEASVITDAAEISRVVDL